MKHTKKLCSCYWDNIHEWSDSQKRLWCHHEVKEEFFCCEWQCMCEEMRQISCIKRQNRNPFINTQWTIILAILKSSLLVITLNWCSLASLHISLNKHVFECVCDVMPKHQTNVWLSHYYLNRGFMKRSKNTADKTFFFRWDEIFAM